MPAANRASIKLSSDFVEEARREAEVLHRSVGAQVEHWARLGRAVESTPGVGVPQVRDALQGQLKIEDMTAEERDRFFDNLSDYFNKPNPAADAYYAELGAREGAVGTDGEGRVVRRMADGSLKRTS
jgi:hypothetical protein